jgi:hypothetical protein
MLCAIGGSASSRCCFPCKGAAGDRLAHCARRRAPASGLSPFMSVGVTRIADSDYGEDNGGGPTPSLSRRRESRSTACLAEAVGSSIGRTRNGHLPALRSFIRAHHDKQEAEGLLLARMPVRAAVSRLPGTDRHQGEPEARWAGSQAKGARLPHGKRGLPLVRGLTPAARRPRAAPLCRAGSRPGYGPGATQVIENSSLS